MKRHMVGTGGLTVEESERKMQEAETDEEIEEQVMHLAKKKHKKGEQKQTKIKRKKDRDWWGDRGAGDIFSKNKNKQTSTTKQKEDETDEEIKVHVEYFAKSKQKNNTSK